MNNIKNKLYTFGTLSLAFVVLLTGGCSPKESTSNAVAIEKSCEQTKKKFAPGEHIISIPIDKNPMRHIIQYPYYDGYKAIGLANYSSNGCILYANYEEVECTATSIDKKGKVIYCDFGIPTTQTEAFDENITEDSKDFGVGEHIISIPMDEDLTQKRFQYPYYEGYEVIDISTISTSSLYIGAYFDGACILYSNTVPVRCKVTNQDKDGNSIYAEFGTPINLDNGRTLK